jgi:hypothetical protein
MRMTGKVEIEESLQTGGFSETELAFWNSLILTFLSFAVFQSAYCLLAITTPSCLNQTTINHPITRDRPNATSVKIRIDSLTPAHRFVTMTVALVRGLAADSAATAVTFYHALDLCRGGHVIAKQTYRLRDQPITFSDGASDSNELKVFRIAVHNYDEINESLTFESDLAKCIGFKFRYTFIDPTALRLMKSVRLILSGSAMYALIVYLNAAGWPWFSADHILSIVLGVSAVIETNPIGLFCSSIEGATPILVIVFLSVYRLTTLITFRKQGGGLKEPWVIGAILIGVIYGSIEALERWTEKFHGELKLCHCGYAILIVFLFVDALRSYKKVERFRAIGFGLFTIVAIGMTIISQVISPNREFSTLPLLLYQSSHVLGAIVFLFFQRGAAIGYQKLALATRRPVDSRDVGVELDEELEVLA